jgi:hypothetical protein
MRAMNGSEPARPSVQVRSKPCTPLRAHPIRRQYRREPTRASSAMRGGPSAGQEYALPLLPALTRSAMRATERIFATNCHHQDRRTSREYWEADLQQGCCCHPQPAKMRDNPTRGATRPCSPERSPLTQTIECSSGSNSHRGTEC